MTDRICALIPAAGKGTRLKADCPKILVPISGETTIWTILRRILLSQADHIHVVLSDFAQPIMQDLLKTDPEADRITTSIQMQALGMGDSIFGAEPYWRDYDTILIAWGDQVNLSPGTIAQVAAMTGQERTLILPLTRQSEPYVQYDFGSPDRNQLVHVRQSREGDITEPGGLIDIGLFALSTGGLLEHWHDFLKHSGKGEATGEVNFLPFMPYLSHDCGWNVETIIVEDQDEARGVNTPEDLEFARKRFLEKESQSFNK